MTFSDPIIVWRKSSASGPEGENCVEVSLGNDVLVRDSKASSAAYFSVSPSAWNSFLSSVKHAR
ncbi:DUF397 domain-containing protein [Streptomyces sp. NPDC059340]|uniref:DUF397 domain-containing protein n=1 Tax=Streptomyces sp. NPDC059340 TaxID=3346806 RepID=UPI00368B3217